MGSLSDIAVFDDDSPYWDYVTSLGMDTHWNSNYDPSAVGDRVSTYWSSTFHFAYWSFTLEKLVAHYNRCLAEMKDYINSSRDMGRLLDDVPSRPTAWESRPLATNRRYEFLGLLAKYNLEYRRPFPQDRNARPLDLWHMRKGEAGQAELVDRMMAPDFRVPDFAWETLSWWDVKWDAPRSSMLVPLKSAFGDPPMAIFREVLGVPFPCFAFINRESFTAAQIEEAWQKLPILRRGKGTRGTSTTSGSSKWRRKDDWSGRWRNDDTDWGGRWREDDTRGDGRWRQGGDWRWGW